MLRLEDELNYSETELVSQRKKHERYIPTADEYVVHFTNDNCGHETTEHYFSIPVRFREIKFDVIESITASPRTGFSSQRFIDGCNKFGIVEVTEIEGIPSRINCHFKGTSGNY